MDEDLLIHKIRFWALERFFDNEDANKLTITQKAVLQIIVEAIFGWEKDK